MKRLYLILIFIAFSLLAFSREYKVYDERRGGMANEEKLYDEC